MSPRRTIILPARTDPDAKRGIVRTAVEVAGAAAGFALLLYGFGGIIFFLRMHALRLPTKDLVALIPTSQLVTPSISALIPGAVLGALLSVPARYYGDVFRRNPVTRTFALLVVLLVLLLPALWIGTFDPVTGSARAWTVVAGLAATAAALLVLRKPMSRARLAVSLAVVGLLCGGALAVIRASSPPVDLNYVRVTFRDGYRTFGFYIGSNSDNLFVAPALDNEVFGRIAALPRSDIVRFTLLSPTVPVNSFHGPHVGALIGGGGRPSPSTASGKQNDNVLSFATRVADSSLWAKPPAVVRLDYLKTHYNEFFGEQVAPWKRDLAFVPLDTVAPDPFFFTGTIITGGRVRVIEDDPLPGGKLRNFVVLESTTKSPGRAICSVVRNDPRGFGVGSKLAVRGTIIAAGGMTTARGIVPTIWLACSASRPYF
jgi:hypothetical protein